MATDLRSIFDSQFGTSWILTGSAAIHQYLNYFGLEANFPVNDIDIIYVHNDLFYATNFNGFTRKQTCPERSMTFINAREGVSFDVSTQPSARFYLIGETRIIDPYVMLDDYESNYSIRGKLPNDLMKINALKLIISILEDPSIDKPVSSIMSIAKSRRQR